MKLFDLSVGNLECKIAPLSVKHFKKNGGSGFKRYIEGIAYNCTIPTHESSEYLSLEASKSNDPEVVYRDPAIRLSDEQLSNLVLKDLPVCLDHEGGACIGKVLTNWMDKNKHLRIIAEIDGNTSAGREVIKMIDNGDLGSLSVAYDVKTHKHTGRVLEKKFREISVCMEPFFNGCQIEVRASRSCSKKRNCRIENSSHTTDSTVVCVLPIRLHKVASYQKIRRIMAAGNEKKEKTTSSSSNQKKEEQKKSASKRKREEENEKDSSENEGKEEEQTKTEEGGEEGGESNETSAEKKKVDGNKYRRLKKVDPSRMSKEELAKAFGSLQKYTDKVVRHTKNLKKECTAHRAREEQNRKEYEETYKKLIGDKWGHQLQSMVKQSGIPEEDAKSATEHLSAVCSDPENYQVAQIAVAAAKMYNETQKKDEKIQRLKEKLAHTKSRYGSSSDESESSDEEEDATSKKSLKASKKAKKKKLDDVYDMKKPPSNKKRVKASKGKEEFIPPKGPASKHSASTPCFWRELLSARVEGLGVTPHTKELVARSKNSRSNAMEEDE